MAWDLLLVAAAALFASGLTLFSGFGLGTLLMPVLALLFPLPLAIATTAVVHLLNNLFKLWLTGRHADPATVLRFGLPAGIGAIVGATLLGWLAVAPASVAFEVFGYAREVGVIELVVGLLIVLFALLELSPRLARLQVPSRYLPAGGLLSGFFGGLSGNQGALRAAFLIRAGLSKEGFVGTGVVCSVIVDTLRIAVYGAALPTVAELGTDPRWLPATVAAVIAAFTGAFFGVRLLGKVTLRFVQLAVAVMMLLIGAGLATGLV